MELNGRVAGMEVAFGQAVAGGSSGQAQPEENFNKAQALEDRALKSGMQAFGESIMRYLGQSGTVKRVAPTEHVHLEMRQMQEDFNFEMAEGFWRHYEFESDRISVEDMRRFREYEAFLSMTYQVPVITTVLCSAKVKRLRSKLREGINTYCVEAIQLKKMDADQILRKLKKKLKSGKKVTREDLIPLLLTPLMSGKTSVCERIVQGFRLLKSAQDCLDKEEVKKMQAILYTFACKFLTREEVKRVKEETDMTILGQMLVEDGIAKGIAQGMAQGMERGQNLFAQLMKCLFTDGRMEDAIQAAEDEEARMKLYKEYGLVE